MITEQHLVTAGVEPETAKQVFELIGAAAEKLYAEDGYKKAKDEDDVNMLTLTGIAKNPNEATRDYLKRAPKEWADKLLSEKTAELQSEIAQTKEQLKNHPGDEGLKKKISDLEAEKTKIPDLIAQSIKEHKDAAEKYKNELTTKEKVWTLKSFIPSNFKTDADAEFKKYKIDSATEKALKEYDEIKEIQGVMTLVNSVTYAQIPVKDFFEKELESVLDKGVKQEGGGAGKQTGQPGSELVIDEKLSDNDKINLIKTYLGTIKLLTPMDHKWTPELNKLLKEHKLDNYVVE